MSNDIQFALDHLAHLLSDRRFEVPHYQRSYSWEPDQVEAFWDDLLANLNGEGERAAYFMGTIVTAESSGKSILIDGQQRLATTSLLLAALRDAYSAKGDHKRANGVEGRYLSSFDIESAGEVSHLKLNDEDRDFFQSTVIDGRVLTPMIGSHRRLSHAQEYLREHLASDLDTAEDWFQRALDWERLLTQRVAVILISVPDAANGFVIFETLNDRGAPLTISDLLRNYLMATAGDQHLDEVQDAWGRVLLNLGLQREESVFVDFVRQDWSSLHGATREKDLYRAIRRRTASSAEVVAYTSRLPNAARNYAGLLDAQHELWTQFPDDVGASVAALLRLELGQYRPLALAVLEVFTPDEQRRTFRALVSWAVRGLLASNIGGGVTERAYGRAAVGVRDGSLASADDVLSLLRPIVPTDRDFRRFFSAASVPKASVARYLMTALERHHQGETWPELVESGFGEGMRLQAIMPRDADPQQWSGFRADEIKSLAARLGNYVLLAEPEKSLDKAADFASRRMRLETSTVQLSRSVGGFEVWSAATIETRQTAFADLAVSIWPREPRSI